MPATIHATVVGTGRSSPLTRTACHPRLLREVLTRILPLAGAARQPWHLHLRLDPAANDEDPGRQVLRDEPKLS